MAKIFFYGLFMDRALLEAKGLHPETIGPAVLHDYRIHIGERATLVPEASRRSYGVVMKLSDTEARDLYSDPSVREYVRESVTVERTDSGEKIEADCYNLPRDRLAGANPAYAQKLSEVVASLGFGDDYVREIAGFTRQT